MTAIRQKCCRFLTARVLAAILMREAQQEIAEAQHDLDGDEADDVPFEPLAALRLHHVEDGADGLVDDRELALHAAAALCDPVLVLSQHFVSHYLGLVPYHVA